MTQNTKSIGVAFEDQNIIGSNLIQAEQTLGFTSAGQGAVTQATSKATGVTTTTPVSIITMNNASLATVTTVQFTLTNARIKVGDQIIVSHSSAGTAGAYNVWANTVASGSCAIQVRNITGGALGEAIVLTVTILSSS
jgi:Flp pilus assembly CpaE family ATPase